EEHGTELWVSDGTSAGTCLVHDILPGVGSGRPQNLTVVGRTLYFNALTHDVGNELRSLPLSSLGFGDGVFDADGDGFSDELEASLSTDPDDPGDTPFEGEAAGTVRPLNGLKSSVKLNFAKPGADGIALKGALALPSQWTPSGLEVVVDVGGVTKTFTLDAKGKAKTESKDSIKISPKNGKFKVKFGKGSYANALEDEQLTGDATVKKAPREVPVTVLMDGTMYRVNAQVLYSAKAGKKGKAK
ncbi:MAG: hypothetical protein ACYTG4_00420, partial [Planctomycetota bacterium]